MSPLKILPTLFLFALPQLPAARAAAGSGGAHLERNGATLSLAVEGGVAKELFDALQVPATVTDVGDTYKSGKNLLCIKRGKGEVKAAQRAYLCIMGLDKQGKSESAD